jgi:hypothetical protein
MGHEPDIGMNDVQCAGCGGAVCQRNATVVVDHQADADVTERVVYKWIHDTDECRERYTEGIDAGI